MKTVLTVFMVLFIISGFAHAQTADDFNDNSMNASLWSLTSSLSPVFDPESRMTVQETDGVLQFTSQGWDDDQEASAGYVSSYELSLFSDFNFSLEYHYSHTGSTNYDNAGINAGLIYFDNSGGLNYVMGGPENYTMDDTHLHEDHYSININWFGVETDQTMNRTATDGRLEASYDSSADELYLAVWENLGADSASDWQVVADDSLTGAKTSGVDAVQLALVGWSEGGALAEGEAYFDNFSLNCGTVTPEPLGCSLFALGSIALAVFKRKKMFKKS